VPAIDTEFPPASCLLNREISARMPPFCTANSSSHLVCSKGPLGVYMERFEGCAPDLSGSNCSLGCQIWRQRQPLLVTNFFIFNWVFFFNCHVQQCSLNIQIKCTFILNVYLSRLVEKSQFYGGAKRRKSIFRLK